MKLGGGPSAISVQQIEQSRACAKEHMSWEGKGKPKIRGSERWSKQLRSTQKVWGLAKLKLIRSEREGAQKQGLSVSRRFGGNGNHFGQKKAA